MHTAILKACSALATLAILAACSTGATTPDEELSKAAPTSDTISLVDSPVVPVEESPRSGPDDAWVTVVVFSDFACPFGARLAATLDFVFHDVENSVARRVFKYHPRQGDPVSLRAAHAAEAARKQGRFWEMHDALFDAHAALSAADSDRLIMEIADSVGLDLEAFKEDYESDEVAERVEKDLALADELDLPDGPSVFVSGGFIAGARSAGVYTEAIARIYSVLHDAVETEEIERSQVYRYAVDALYDHTRRNVEQTRRGADPVVELPIGGEGPDTSPIEESLVQVGIFTDLSSAPTRQMLRLFVDKLAVSDDEIRLTFFHLLGEDDEATRLAHRALEGAESHRTTIELLTWLVEEDRPWQTDVDLLRDRLEQLGIEAVDDDVFDKAVEADRSAAKRYGVYATPTLFINGIRLTGLHDAEQVEEIIEEQRVLAKEIAAREDLRGWSLYEQVVETNRERILR